MARSALFSLLVVVTAIAGCGSSPAPVVEDAGMQPDAWDLCNPVVLEPTVEDACVLPLPGGFLPARMFYVFEDGDQALERLPDAGYCEGVAGGFYVDDETAPTTATVCPTTCAELAARGTAEISATVCGI